MIVLAGERVSLQGTSISAPTANALFSLLTDVRLSHGLSPLGFLNPLLYALGASDPAVFNDMTYGNNPGCNTTGFNVSRLSWKHCKQSV